MKTVDIQHYIPAQEKYFLHDKNAVNMQNGEVVTILLGGVNSKKILFEDSKGKRRDMMTKNFVKKYQLLVD